ncbi:hypothetical protein FH972_023630 [Carpinus fangiana]|uniref:Uncharacterized protein n=1 Tax=Carpinus fangiana TaxID=176857 RepID=A0A5N6KW02_9ROSI|nr:hypothetical protein FH972_023630 [Carpinus fangiana]
MALCHVPCHFCLQISLLMSFILGYPRKNYRPYQNSSDLMPVVNMDYPVRRSNELATEYLLEDRNTHEDRDHRVIASYKGSSIKILGIHFIFFCLYSAVFAILLLQCGAKSNQIKNLPVKYIIAADSQYAGNRSETVDRAWEELLSGINSRASISELESSSISSVKLPEGEYLVWPEALHQLHCVKRIREWVYREQYLGGLSGSAEHHWMVHVDHCIELLRQAIMCKPDRGRMGFHWTSESDRPTLNLNGPNHMCEDWGSYKREVCSRSVSRSEMEAATPEIMRG